jgi:hypothetical protein
MRALSPEIADRVTLARQEEEDRRVRQEVYNIAHDESVDGEDMIDDDGFPDDRSMGGYTRV